MNLARGTGIRGLSGIRPVNGYMIRPLLGINRKEIEYYLKEHQLSYCEDETNAGDEYTRNRIRHQILPMLEEQVNRQAIRHMNETMEQFKSDQRLSGAGNRSALQMCGKAGGRGAFASVG